MAKTSLSVLSQLGPAKDVPRLAPKPWNDNLYDWIAEQANKRPGVITVAGPPGCVDRPWWWGQTETGQSKSTR